MPVSPKRKRPTTQNEIEKQLKTIYDNDSPSDFTKIEKVRRRRWPKIILAALFLFAAAGAAWFGIMRFGAGNRYGDNIDVTVEGPNSVRSGEAAVWTVNYKNKELRPIASADLVFNLPKSITVLTSEPPTIENTLEWKLGTIAPGGGGKITVRGRVLEAVGASVAAQAVLSYRPANFNADFQKVASWQGTVADATIEATLTAPDEAVPSDLVEFALSIKRRNDASADAELPDLTVRFDTGDIVVAKNTVPDLAYPADKTWIIKPPEAEKESLLKITGNFISGLNGDAVLKADVGTTDAGGAFIVLVPLAATVKLTPGDLVITIIRNGTTNDGTANFGDTLHVSVDYENKSSKPISDAKILLAIEDNAASVNDSVLDWKSLSDPRGGTRNGKTITWGKGQIPDLATIAPGEKGTIDVSVVSLAAPPDPNVNNYSVSLSAVGLIGALGGKPSGKTVLTPKINTVWNTDAQILAAAAASDGPLPPKSGGKTTYEVVWTITNTLHEISGINVNAALADGVVWENHSELDAGDLRYDAGNQTVVWTLNRLPTSIKSVSLKFYVSLTPDADAIGKSLPLLSAAALTATDKTTGAIITRTASALDTNIQSETDNVGIVLP